MSNSDSGAGIVNANNGTVIAMTSVESKSFKTEAGARRWLESRGYRMSLKPVAEGGTDGQWVKL